MRIFIRARLAGSFGASEPDFRVELQIEKAGDKFHAEGRVVNAKAGEIVAASRFDADLGDDLNVSHGDPETKAAAVEPCPTGQA